MSEFPPNIAESAPVNVALLDHALNLGYPVRTLALAGSAVDVVSERQLLLAESTDNIRRVHTSMSAVAEQLGIPLTPIGEWRPEGAELAGLQHEQRAQRRRFQMLDGLADCIASDSFMHRLLPQQRDAMRATQTFMEVATRMRTTDESPLFGKSGYIDVPTGMGKTGMLVGIAQAIKSKESPNDPIKVLILSPTQQILLQTISDPSLRPKDRKGFAKFASNLRPTAYYAEDHTLSDLTVVTNTSFNRLVQSGQMPDFDVVLIDETHTGLGENISDSIRAYYGDKFTIGFSATPDYHEEKMTSQLLEHKIFKITLPEAIKAGRLAPVHAEHRELTLDFDEADLPEDPRERQAVITRAYLEARLADSMEDIKKDVREGRGVLIRCPPGGDIAHAKRAAEILREELISTEGGYFGPIRAVAVGGSKQNVKDLNILLNGFDGRDDREAKVQVICYVDVINMGADLPWAKGYYDLWPMTSRVKVVQGIGRALRLVIDRVTKKPIPAKIVTYQDPSLGDRQYSCRDAFELRPGQASLRQQYEYTERPTANSRFIFKEFNPRRVDSGQVIGEVAIQHNVDVEYELPEESEQPLLSFDEACALFRLDPNIAEYYLREFGYEGRPELSEDDYRTLAEMIAEEAEVGEDFAGVTEPTEQTPRTKREVLTEGPPQIDGYMEMSEFALRSGWRGKLPALRRQLRGLGFKLLAVKHEGKIHYYHELKYIPATYLKGRDADTE